MVIVLKRLCIFGPRGRGAIQIPVRYYYYLLTAHRTWSTIDTAIVFTIEKIVGVALVGVVLVTVPIFSPSLWYDTIYNC